MPGVNPRQFDFFDKDSQSLDCEASPPSNHQLGSYNNLLDHTNPISIGATVNGTRHRGGSAHSLKGVENPLSIPSVPATTIYQRAASASPHRYHRQGTLAAGKESGPLSPNSVRSLPNSLSGDHLSHTLQQPGTSRGLGGGDVGGVVPGQSVERQHIPQPIRITSPYVTSPPAVKSPITIMPGYPKSASTLSQTSVVKDRSRTLIRAHSNSRESLGRSRENISRSREHIKSREGLSNSEEMLNRSQDVSISSGSVLGFSTGGTSTYSNRSGEPLQSPLSNDGSSGATRTISFVRALQMTEAAEVREREVKQSIRSKRLRKESSKSVYDTTYEASV